MCKISDGGHLVCFCGKPKRRHHVPLELNQRVWRDPLNTCLSLDLLKVFRNSEIVLRTGQRHIGQERRVLDFTEKFAILRRQFLTEIQIAHVCEGPVRALNTSTCRLVVKVHARQVLVVVFVQALL